jgi:hypothetical protein
VCCDRSISHCRFFQARISGLVWQRENHKRSHKSMSSCSRFSAAPIQHANGPYELCECECALVSHRARAHHLRLRSHMQSSSNAWRTHAVELFFLAALHCSTVGTSLKIAITHAVILKSMTCWLLDNMLRGCIMSAPQQVHHLILVHHLRLRSHMQSSSDA